MNKKLIKDNFHSLLGKSFGETVREKDFPWLIVARLEDEPEELRKIRSALTLTRGFTEFTKAGRKLRYDFFIPQARLLIEVDEFQHFTSLRAVALRNYPPDTPLGFDRNEWISHCEKIRAKDPDPPYRDEQRAYYDSMRDLLAPANGMQPLIRVKIEDLVTRDGVERALAKLSP